MLLNASRVYEGLAIDQFNEDPTLKTLRQVSTVWIYLIQKACLLYLRIEEITEDSIAESYHLMRWYRNMVRIFSVYGLTTNVDSLTIVVPYLYQRKKTIQEPHTVESTEGGEGANKVYKSSSTNNSKKGLRNMYFQKLKKNHDRNLTTIYHRPDLFQTLLTKRKANRKVRKDKKDLNTADYLSTLWTRERNRGTCMCGERIQEHEDSCQWCLEARDKIIPILDSGVFEGQLLESFKKSLGATSSTVS